MTKQSRIQPEESGRRADLIRMDKAHVWHPFTQMKDWVASEPLIIESGDGCELIDIDGNRYIDGVSSLWVNVHGHCVPEIDEAVSAQLGKIAHTTLLGLANVPSAELADDLVRRAPDGLDKVFYSEAGACAVEIALKMAFGYWQHRGAESKKTFLSLDHAYHGDTIGAVSVGGIDLFHAAYRPMLFDVFKAPSPYCYRCPLEKSHPSCQIACLQAMEATLAEHHEEICAVIVEPLVQGAAGMITSPPGYLKGVRDLCSRFDVLMIADEVATGVGRTGTFFACEHEGVSPDILVAGKGLTGGYLPLAATLTTNAVFDAFIGDYDEFKTLFHGHTYTGNPLGCAAALANLALMDSAGTLAHVKKLEPAFDRALEPVRRHAHVGQIRRRGLMCGVELVADRSTKAPFDAAARTGAKVAERARGKGVIIRPLGDIVILMPPLAIQPDQLRQLVAATLESIDEVTAT